MKARIFTVISALLMLIMSIGGQASAAFSTPPSWIPMTMLNVTFDSATNKLAVVSTTSSALLGTNTTSSGSPAPGIASFDPAQPWAVLNNTAFSRRFGWYDPNQGDTTGLAILDQVHAFYGPAANIWIQSVTKSPGLNNYQAIGVYGVNSDDTQTVDPSANGYAPIFGTSGSSTTWQWDGMMDHNANAVPFSFLNAPNQSFSATYKIYVGDILGNELLTDISGNPVASASTTTTWSWQGPAFVFTSQTGVPTNTLVESDIFTVTGITGTQPISINGGEYSISTDGGTTWSPYSSTPATVANGNQVKVHQTSSAGYGTTATATLSIPAVPGPGTFTVTTVDGIPDPFSFTSMTGVDPATIYVSNTITVTDIDTPASISISSGGKYAVSSDNGLTWSAWSASVGTVSNNNLVKIQLTSSAAANTTVSTTLTIGGVTGNFSITTNSYIAPPTWMPMTMLNISLISGTLAIAAPPSSVALSTVTPFGTFDPSKPWAALNGTSYSRQLGWNAASGLNSAAITAAFNNPDAGIWIERISASAGLETFQAIGKYGVNSNNTTTVDSAANAYAPIFGTAGSSTKWKWDYNMDHNANAVPAAYITAPNQLFTATYRIYVGDSLGNDIAPSAATTTTWTWQGPAVVPDTVPDAFSFTSQTGVAPNTLIESNSITVTGIAFPSLISITGGEYSISTDGGTTWSAYSTSTPTTVANGSQVKVHQTSSASYATTTTAVLSIGGVSGSFSVTTAATPQVTVPNVVGLTQAAAQSAITAATLTAGTVTQASSATVPAGSVISQNPAAGASVLPGSTVDLVVSVGSAPVSVPNVVGRTQAKAKSAITAKKLTVGTITQAYSATVPSGRVISQNPQAGALAAPGTAVDLVVSTGPAPVTVPNVTGLTQADAKSAITGATLTVGIITKKHNDTVPAGSVISQNPQAGSSVAPGSAVKLLVSTGPAPVVVPRVVGHTQADADSAITARTLIVGTVTQAYSSIVPSGSVISQNPRAGVLVAPGSAVNLVVSAGHAPVTVPNVVGRTQAIAKSAINAAKLTVGAITKAQSATIQSGRVISQNPLAGALVARGSAVDLVVSTGP